MTVTLCIETSGPHCSLAVAKGEEIHAQQRLLDRSHNLHLLPLLDELFARASLSPRDVEIVAFGRGPGSFTGVRIAAAAAQAVAFAADARVVPIASSRVLAMSAVQMQPANSVWLCCLPSRGLAYYISAYARRAGSPDGQQVANLQQLHPDELLQAPPHWLGDAALEGASGIGTLPPWLAPSLQDSFKADVHPSAAAMVGFARHCHANGGSLPVEQALPMYIAGDSPWHKRKSSNVSG